MAAAAEMDLIDEDVSHFDRLGRSYASLNWRLESKPGGATVKPDAFYKLYGLYMQATLGASVQDRCYGLGPIGD